MNEPRCPHCDTPIMEHLPERCLDAWVHISVMGNELPADPDDYGPCFSCGYDGLSSLVPYYSDQGRGAAWLVLSKVKLAIIAPGATYAGGEYINGPGGYLDFAESSESDFENYREWIVEAGRITVSNENLALAICRAAIMAAEG